MNFRKHKLSYPMPFIRLLPSIITLLGLSVGLSSIRYAFDSKWEAAITCILVAVLIDGLDGRIARLLNAASSFGAELDSLCDFVNFGLTAALITYLWLDPDQQQKLVSWISVLVFVICTAIRLARFNISILNHEHSNKKKYFFVGVPAPLGAVLCLMPVMLDFNIFPILNWQIKDYKLCINIYLLIVGFLMASRIPTFSIKSITVKPQYIWICLLLFATVGVTLLIYPWYIIPVFALWYIISIPVSIVVARRIN
ncbi:CDP-alcohol phosphatidyltransferase family protein [Orientia chuto str. Dubai]|uniref:CDP-alcohol phosphatidyltransferase family protein n=2 Tax=Candidatus Orientia mediorientalis TaxID=911112 RepID=A0A0F3MN13_9RICK|nr:CDP-alcohol phosphatidyltransferase family protein [Orientia chuto str. Dubai]